MRKALLSLSVLGLMVLPTASAAAGPLDDAKKGAEAVICLVKHGYFYCYGD